MKKFAITGPESTGKSTLAKQLAEYFGGTVVPEFSRSYLANLQRPYGPDDVLAIARGQAALEEQLARQFPQQPLFCDTSMLVCKVWQSFKYGAVDPWIEKAFEQQPVDLYLLCQPDLPWEEDPLREHPQQRGELFELYQQALEKAGKPYVVVAGQGPQRLAGAIEAVEKVLE